MSERNNAMPDERLHKAFLVQLKTALCKSMQTNIENGTA